MLLTYIRTNLWFADPSMPHEKPPPIDSGRIFRYALVLRGDFPFGLLVREICNQRSTPRLRPTYREVTACDGTFPDTVTYLHEFRTLISPDSSHTGRLRPQFPALATGQIICKSFYRFACNPPTSCRSSRLHGLSPSESGLLTPGRSFLQSPHPA